MSDLISRKVLLEILNTLEAKAWSMVVKQKSNTEEYWKQATLVAERRSTANMIATMPPAQQWIPVEEGLPEEEGEYLVTFRETGELIEGEYIDVTVLEYIPKLHVWVDYFENEFNVIAWQPLPEPYRKE